MSCRSRVSLPFIPSTCLIPTDTSRITTHVRIKNRSIKIMSASCGHHNGRLQVAARDNRKAGRISCARIAARRRHTISQHSGIGVLVIQVQVYCSCSRKETGNAKTAAVPQVHLLQPAVIVKRHKKHVLCV